MLQLRSEEVHGTEPSPTAKPARRARPRASQSGKPKRKRRVRSPSVSVAKLVARPGGRYQVEFSLDGERRRALARRLRSSTSLCIGQELVIAFEDDDPTRPIIVGTLEDHRHAIDAGHDSEADPRRLVLEAHDELVLLCGKSSITLTRAGKVIIRGEYVLSRSAGVNSIKGAVVQLN